MVTQSPIDIQVLLVTENILVKFSKTKRWQVNSVMKLALSRVRELLRLMLIEAYFTFKEMYPVVSHHLLESEML